MVAIRDARLIGGPFPMLGESVYGHLNPKGNRLAMADIAYGQVDIYSYSPTSVKYYVQLR